MPSSLDNLNVVVGDLDAIGRLAGVPALPPFSGAAIQFLNDVFRRLMDQPATKNNPDVATFAFWCRRASIERLRASYGDLSNRLGRGVAFHIAPSNVPVNFAYSLAIGLLSGNANVVRIPSKDFPQVGLICGAIRNSIDSACPDMRDRICLVKYGHEKAVTDELSLHCDARLIWGGDDTIRSIRGSPIPLRAVEIAFADRYSFAIVDADIYLKLDPVKVAQDFYNDTYLTDQNACTSPQLVVWRGTAIEQAKSRFWPALHRLLTARYELQPVQAVGKWSAVCKLADEVGGKLEPSKDNLITRVKVPGLCSKLMDFKCHSGIFVEFDMREMAEILPMCTIRCQTIACLGLEPKEIADWVFCHAPRGVDRIVPVGRTMDFSLAWDGYDLIRILSRTIAIE